MADPDATETSPLLPLEPEIDESQAEATLVPPNPTPAGEDAAYAPAREYFPRTIRILTSIDITAAAIGIVIIMASVSLVVSTNHFGLPNSMFPLGFYVRLNISLPHSQIHVLPV